MAVRVDPLQVEGAFQSVAGGGKEFGEDFGHRQQRGAGVEAEAVARVRPELPPTAADCSQTVTSMTERTAAG